MVGVIRMVGMIRVVQVVQVVQMFQVVQVVSLDDMHSENIWFSWYKPSRKVDMSRL